MALSQRRRGPTRAAEQLVPADDLHALVMLLVNKRHQNEKGKMQATGWRNWPHVSYVSAARRSYDRTGPSCVRCAPSGSRSGKGALVAGAAPTRWRQGSPAAPSKYAAACMNSWPAQRQKIGVCQGSVCVKGLVSRSPSEMQALEQRRCWCHLNCFAQGNHMTGTTFPCTWPDVPGNTGLSSQVPALLKPYP